MFSFLSGPSRSENVAAKALTGLLFAGLLVAGGCNSEAAGQTEAPIKKTQAASQEHKHEGMEVAKLAAEDTALIMFVTRNDPVIAGHALHVATTMRGHGRTAIICLIGDGGKLALKGAKTEVSMTNGESLQSNLQTFIKNGGKVSITPFTVESLGISKDDLIEGVFIGGKAHKIGKVMYKPNTRVFVW